VLCANAAAQEHRGNQKYYSCHGSCSFVMKNTLLGVTIAISIPKKMLLLPSVFHFL
jgi:hypothetical protein